MKTRLILLLALLAQMPAQAYAQQAIPAARYTLSVDGHEVTDQVTGLIWRRCAEGMAWEASTCSGTALTFSHENALLRAKSEATSAKAWRLPNVKELASLVDRSRISPAIDVSAFPATPSAWFWSSSPYAGDVSLAWFVIFYDGSVYGGLNRDNSSAVRLVRASQ